MKPFHLAVYIFLIAMVGFFIFAGYMAVVKDHADLIAILGRVLGVTVVGGVISIISWAATKR